MTLPIRPLPSCSCSLPCAICTHPSRPSGKCTKDELCPAHAIPWTAHGPLRAHRPPTLAPLSLTTKLNEHSSLCAASKNCAIPSGNQHGPAVSSSRQNPISRGMLACDVAQNIVAIHPSPSLPRPNRRPALSSWPCSLLHKAYTSHRALPAFGFRNPAHRCLPDHGRTLRAQASTRPPRWALPTGNTACVCTAAQALPARTLSCHHHGPAAIWPIVLIDCHLHLAEIAPSPLSVPNPANCGCSRRSSPKTRLTTTRPGHHHSSRRDPAMPMQRPRNNYTSS